jgi:hypothetical protein
MVCAGSSSHIMASSVVFNWIIGNPI